MCKQTLVVVVAMVVGIGSSQAQTPVQQETSRTPVSGPAPNARESTSAGSVPLEKPGYVAPSELSRVGFSGHMKDFVEDQTRIWTSPSRVRLSDSTWLVPLAGIAAGLFVTDRQYSASLNQNPSTLKHYKTVSDVGIAGLIGAGAGLYFLSFPTHNERWRETGFLAGEAALNSLVTVEALKYSMGRERPYQANGSGAFFRGGTSFPSEHAAAAWSIAGVIAHEYPGTIPSLLAYGVASAVSLSRIQARQHFPSDVLVGSTLGYLIAQDVFRRRHNPELGGAAWESPHEFVNDPSRETTSSMASPYVPLDSWIYPAIERLAALGYIQTASLGIRPWTRTECARLVGEAAGNVDDAPGEIEDLYHALADEFAYESGLTDGDSNLHAQLESVYQRSLGISGTPLTDGYHFGQTVQNDYGRPFQRGFNTVAGASSWAVAGSLVFYARGEYQYAPAGPVPSSGALNFISSVDYLPANAPSVPVASTNRFRLLDAYVGMDFQNWQMSFGKQSLWWGPSAGGTMAFSDNAEPITMFRVNRVSPFRLPSFLGYLGNIRLDLFLGQLSGQEFINNSTSCCVGSLAQGQYGKNLKPQPFLSGGRISFKFTDNFEFNMSKTTIYGGPGNPLTAKTFLESTFGVHTSSGVLGDGRTVADFSYRIPKLRNWLTLYGEGFSEDEVSPLNTPQKSVWQGGLYFAKLPRASKVDFRIEGGSTSPADFSTCNGCFYHNLQYLNGYTNDGQLIGTWIGRAAQGESIESNYWLSATRKIGVELKHRKIDAQFLPQGGTQNDIAVNADFLIKSGFRFSGTLQYEKWQIPLLASQPQQNITAAVQLAFWPHVGR